MPTVVYDHQTERYQVLSRGTIESQHRTASAAKRAGKRLGKKFGEPVSYQGPRMDNAEWIYRPSPEEQFGNGDGGNDNGGFLGLF